MAIFKASKDPSDVLDYQFNWQSGRKPGLATGEIISESTWYADTGITIDDDANTDTTVTVWLSGGTAGHGYTVTNHIVTSEEREFDQSIRISVDEH